MVTNNSYSQNWTGGESSSLNWILNGNFSPKLGSDSTFLLENNVKLAFGQLHRKEIGNKLWSKPEKSIDLIDLETVFKFSGGKKTIPFFSNRILSQFIDSNGLKINPITFSQSFGLSRGVVKGLNVRLGISMREYLDRGGGRASEVGSEVVSSYKKDWSDNKTKFLSKLIGFQSIGNKPVVEFENILSVMVVSHLMIQVIAVGYYDEQINKGIRWKNVMSMGFSW